MIFLQKIKNTDWTGSFYFLLMIFVAKRRPDILKKQVDKKAMEIAATRVMQILDAEGLSHCQKCPRRFALRRVGKSYLCGVHASMETDASRVQ